MNLITEALRYFQRAPLVDLDTPHEPKGQAVPENTHYPGFTFRYAIRMPNGELYRHPQAQQQVEDLTASSLERDMNKMLGMIGWGTSSSAPKPQPTGPAIFDNRKDAENLLGQIQAQAAAVGVTHWGGTVVTQLCTPFTPGDPAESFWPAIAAWLSTQGMEA